MMKTLKQSLGFSPAGRIVLHLFCILRNGHFRWHLQGIAREFDHVGRGGALALWIRVRIPSTQGDIQTP